jgi:hypothetical protein
VTLKLLSLDEIKRIKGHLISVNHQYTVQSMVELSARTAGFTWPKQIAMTVKIVEVLIPQRPACGSERFDICSKPKATLRRE